MTTYHINVKPNAKQQVVQRNDDGSFMIRLKSPPVDGKANAELIQVLADYFHVPKSSIQIKSGQSSRYKVIEIPDSAKTTEL